MSETPTDLMIDRLVDTKQISYTEAFAELGLSPPAEAPVKAEAITQRNADSAYYDQEFKLSGSELLTDSQRAVNAAGAAVVKAALQAARERGDTPLF